MEWRGFNWISELKTNEKFESMSDAPITPVNAGAGGKCNQKWTRSLTRVARCNLRWHISLPFTPALSDAAQFSSNCVLDYSWIKRRTMMTWTLTRNWFKLHIRAAHRDGWRENNGSSFRAQRRKKSKSCFQLQFNDAVVHKCSIAPAFPSLDGNAHELQSSVVTFFLFFVASS